MKNDTIIGMKLLLFSYQVIIETFFLLIVYPPQLLYVLFPLNRQTVRREEGEKKTEIRNSNLQDRDGDDVKLSSLFKTFFFLQWQWHHWKRLLTFCTELHQLQSDPAATAFARCECSAGRIPAGCLWEERNEGGAFGFSLTVDGSLFLLHREIACRTPSPHAAHLLRSPSLPGPAELLHVRWKPRAL